MKRIFLFIVAAIMSAGVASAQDLNEAITLAKDGNAAFELGEYNLAIEAFTKALGIAESIEGDEAANHVGTCKTAICAIYMANSKALLKAGEYDGALAKLNETIAIAEQYGSENTVSEAQKLIPNVYMAQGNNALKSKDAASAIAAYTKVIEINPANGDAYLRLGRAFATAGKIDEAVAAYETAAANGEEKDAKKQLSTIFTKMAQAGKKAQKWGDVLSNAEKSLSYLETPNALNYAGEASAKLGKNAQAIEYFEKYLAIAPNAKNANNVKYQIAVAAEALGNKAKAVEFYQMVVNDPTVGDYSKHKVAELSK